MPNHSGESGLHPVDHDQDRQRSCQLEDLDDACLINIFSRLTPLPDLFSVSRSCRRFRELTTDGRMWLLVSTEVGPGRRLSASGRHCRCMFPTLHEAVAASRPGDTIIIEPGETHIAQDVAIPWPLQLLGGGSMPESTVLTCPKGADAAALDFRATAKLANLTVCATMGACVMHRRGRLSVEGCMLRCEAGGLDHLFTPLVTIAAQSVTRRTSTTPTAGGGVPKPPAAFQAQPSTAQPAAQQIACAAQPGATTASSVAGGHINASVEAPPVEACDGPVLVVPALAVRQFASVGGPQGAEPAVGVLSVVETKIRGGRGSLAVRCCGTGQLQSVRIINLMKDTLYWFDVDSSSPGYVVRSLPRSLPFATQHLKMGSAAGLPILKPSWASGSSLSGSTGSGIVDLSGQASQGIEPSKRSVTSKDADVQRSTAQQPSDVALRRKARDWEQAHHASAVGHVPCDVEDAAIWQSAKRARLVGSS